MKQNREKIIDQNLQELESLDFEAIETPPLEDYKSFRQASEQKFASIQTKKLTAYKNALQRGETAPLPALTKKAFREVASGERPLEDADVYTSRIDYNQAYATEMRQILQEDDAKRGLTGTYEKAKVIEGLFVTYLNNSKFFDLEDETLKTRIASDYDDLENGVDIYSLIEGEPNEDGSAPSLIIAFDITSTKLDHKLTKKLTGQRHQGTKKLRPGETTINYYAKPGEDDPAKQQREYPKTHVLLYTLSLGDKSAEDVLAQTEIDENGMSQNGIDAMSDLKLKFLLQIQAQNYYYLASVEREIAEIEEAEDDYPPIEYADSETRDVLEPLEKQYDSALRWKQKIEKMIWILENSIYKTKKEMLTSDLPAAESTIRYILGKKKDDPLTQDDVDEGVQKYFKQIQEAFGEDDISYGNFSRIAEEETSKEHHQANDIQLRRRAKQLGIAATSSPEE